MIVAGDRLLVSWADFNAACQKLADRVRARVQAGTIRSLYGIPIGGSFVAAELCHLLPHIPHAFYPDRSCLIVDDLVDSGRTLQPFVDSHPTDALYRKPHSPSGLAKAAEEVEGWVVFPWEGRTTGPEDAVVRLLEWIGEDPNREGLLETPKRVTKALREMCSGYDEDPKDILSKRFTADYDEMIVQTGIRFESLCEHHLLPFLGTCSIGYIPQGFVLGASKLTRLVRCFCRRLQIQERLTTQIAKAIEKSLECVGVGVVMRANHTCMQIRGIEQKDVAMTTSCLLGKMRDSAARAEFLNLCRFK